MLVMFAWFLLRLVGSVAAIVVLVAACTTRTAVLLLVVGRSATIVLLRRRWLLIATTVLLAVLLAACQPGNTDRPVPSVNQIGSDLKCSSGDHGYADPAGWGFCYPADWKYTLRAQPSQDLRGLQELDVTFDITSVPTVNGSPLPSCPTPA